MGKYKLETIVIKQSACKQSLKDYWNFY